MKQYTKIQGLSGSRRIPRIDKIRLGAKAKKGLSGKEYPVELPFFLLPDSVAAVHGGKFEDIEARAKALKVTRPDALKFIKENAYRLAEEIPVMIPIENEDVVFPQAYKLYGGSIGVKCVGDGENASERVGITNEFIDRTCPCEKLKSDTNEKGECSIVANLQVILPEVDMGGVFQIDIGSINSIIDINSGIDYVRSLFGGRSAMIPLILRRIPTETHHAGKKQIHWTVQLKPVGDIKTILAIKDSDKFITHAQVALLDAPDTTDPKLGPADMVYEQSEDISTMLSELDDMKKNKKLYESEIESVRKAVSDNDDATIEAVYNTANARKITGSSANETAAKLTAGQAVPASSTISQSQYKF